MKLYHINIKYVFHIQINKFMGKHLSVGILYKLLHKLIQKLNNINKKKNIS